MDGRWPPNPWSDSYSKTDWHRELPYEGSPRVDQSAMPTAMGLSRIVLATPISSRVRMVVRSRYRKRFRLCTFMGLSMYVSLTVE